MDFKGSYMDKMFLLQQTVLIKGTKKVLRVKNSTSEAQAGI
jgi:hypothetical protein